MSKTKQAPKPEPRLAPTGFTPWTDSPANFYGLLADWIENKDRQDDLIRALRFAATGKIHARSLVPQDLAASCWRHGGLPTDELKHYPTTGNLLRFLAGCPVVPCDPREANYVLAVAGEVGAGCGRGDVVVYDTRNKVDPGEDFRGTMIWYKAIPAAGLSG